MTPVDLRATLALAGLSQLELARVLAVDARTVRRWISGEVEIPPPVGKILYLASRGLVSWQAVKNAKP